VAEIALIQTAMYSRDDPEWYGSISEALLSQPAEHCDVGKLKWRAPEHCSAKLSGTEQRIYDTILSTQLEMLKITYNAVKGEPKELKLVHL
jgi:hypothetical protein